MVNAMQHLEDQGVVEELARQAIGATAPQELPLFNATAKAYFENPPGSVGRAAAKDEKLGFGVVEAAAFLTPYVLEVAKAVFQYLLRELASAAEQDAAHNIVKRLNRLLHREASTDERLTDEQLARVHEVALTTAQRLHLPADQAELLATSVAGTLAVG